MSDEMGDFANPDIINVDVVIRQINQAHRVLGDTTWWAGQLSYTNLTVLALANEIKRLTDGIAEALADLDAYHRPEPTNSDDPVGCILCWPEHESWPCASRLVADDLRALIEKDDDGR